MYLRQLMGWNIGQHGELQLAFILVKSRVDPKGQLSMPSVELSDAFDGAQFAKLHHS